MGVARCQFHNVPPIWPLLQTTSFDPPNFFSKLGPWYLGMVFTSDGRWNKDIDTRIGNANTVMRELYRSVSQNVSFSGICSDLYLWSWILGKDWKSTIWSASGKEGIFAKSSRCDTQWRTQKIFMGGSLRLGILACNKNKNMIRKNTKALSSSYKFLFQTPVRCLT